MNKAVKLIISIAIPLAVGASAGIFTAAGVENWYPGIQKPAWNPPNGVFAPVWTSLYILMGIALYLVWISGADARRKKTAIILFAVQLLLNFFWSFIFFELHQPGWAFAEILLLWVFILLTIFAFARVNRVAAWLLVPYISWVSFAALLNYSIWVLNS